eukprot:UN25513
MNLFNICGEKIKNVKRALVVETLLQIHGLLPMRPQAEFYSKQTRRDYFTKRQNSTQKERRKEHNRTLNINKRVQKCKKNRHRYVQQGIFNCDKIDQIKIKNSISYPSFRY